MIGSTALTTANGEVQGAEGGLQGVAEQAQQSAANLASQATPVNTSTILYIIGGVVVIGILAYAYTKRKG
jgi:hypothetical protein